MNLDLFSEKCNECRRSRNKFTDVEAEHLDHFYIDSYIDSNEKDLTSEYLSSHKHDKYVPHRATFYRPERAEEIIERSNRVDCEYILEEAEELRLQLEQDDMGEYEENLDSI